MLAGVRGEGPHKLHPSRLGRHTGADQRRTALFLHSRREVLHRSHVEPARGGILALGQLDRLAGYDRSPLQGFTLPEKLLPGDGPSGRGTR